MASIDDSTPAISLQIVLPAVSHLCQRPKAKGILLDRIPNLAILAHSSLTIAGSDARPDCFLILSGRDSVVDFLHVSVVALQLCESQHQCARPEP